MRHFDIGIDVGGTFTDLVSFDLQSKTIGWKKVPTTPENLEHGVLQALEGKAPTANRIVHGTTIATNAILQRKGARVALVTTKGLKDQIEIGDTLRYTGGLHNHKWLREKPFMVPNSRRYEVDERVAHNGDIIRKPSSSDLLKIVERIKVENVTAVAVCFLNSYVNDANELETAAFLRRNLPGLWVTHSAYIPEYREFPRFMTAVLSAYVAPILSAYVERLSASLKIIGYEGEVSYMTSSGGISSQESSMLSPISIVGSGVAGGASAAAELSTKIDADKVINFEMGGTSTDVCIVEDHKPGISTDKVLLAFPILLPEVDVKSIGAGGGSVAYADTDGRLKVGPQSAGASPGPACYGNGGEQFTVTDANLLLGRLGKHSLIGGEMQLDDSFSMLAARNLGESVSLEDLGALAEGVLDIAVTHMYGAIRELTIERGKDPTEYKLVATGGAGPLHAIPLALMLGIETVVVPPSPGTFSAMGMLVSDLRHDFVRTYLKPLSETHMSDVKRLCDSMTEEAEDALGGDGIESAERKLEFSAEMRYLEQSFVEHVSFDPNVSRLVDLAENFTNAYENRYGYSRDTGMIEIVNLRLVATGSVLLPESNNEIAKEEIDAVKGERQVRFFGEVMSCTIYDRGFLAEGLKIIGPAIVEEYASTTALFPGWELEVDKFDNLLMTPVSD